jgi:tellurite resistance protein
MGNMSEPTSIASASLVIDRPLDLVRAHFFDIDHAIRAELHPGVTLQRLEPGPDGERHIRQEMKYLNRVQIDDFVIERRGDGAWVKRFVDGPNAGARFVAHFEAEASGRTSVRIQALVPSGAFISGLGKLSALGMEKALHKLLAEYQRALASYEEHNTRSSIPRAVEALKDLAADFSALAEPERRAVISNLLAAAYVVAVAGGEVDAGEREALTEIAWALCDVELDEASIDQAVAAVAAAVEAQGIEARCDKIGARLAALRVAELGVAVATLVAMSSHGIDAPELAAISRIAAAARLDDDAVSALAAHVERALLGE